MKKYVYLPILCVPIVAWATEYTVWIDENKVCDDLCLTQPTDGSCCPASDKVTRFIFASRADADADVKIDDTEIIDSNGYVKAGAASTLVDKTASSGGTLSRIDASYSCKTGTEQNGYGVCVSSLALQNTDPDQEYETYIDWATVLDSSNDGENGYEMPANDVGKGGPCENGKYYSDFDVVFHWCPKNYSGNSMNWDGLPCNENQYPPIIMHYKWTDRTGGNSLTPGKAYYTYNGNSQFVQMMSSTDCTGGTSGGPECTSRVKQLNFPEVSGWKPRGFYILHYANPVPTGGQDLINYNWSLKNRADNLVTEANNTWGAARFGLPKPNSSTEYGYIDLNDYHYEANGAWGNTRWSIWSCSNIPTNTQVHVYAGWTRDCDITGTEPNSTICQLRVKRTGEQLSDYSVTSNVKGDVHYGTSCTSGYTMQSLTDGTYHPTCVKTTPATCSADNLGACNTGNNCASLGDSYRYCLFNDTGHCGSKTQTEFSDLVVTERELCCNDKIEYCTHISDNGTGSKGEATCKNLNPNWTWVEDSNDIGHCENPSGDIICPTQDSLQNIANPHVTVTLDESAGTQCNYTLSCETGYTGTPNGNITCTTVDECRTRVSNYTCSFTCPSVSGISVDNGRVEFGGKTSSDSCTYTLSCNDNFQVYDNNGAVGSSKTLTCDGSECTDSWLSGQVNSYYCQVQCPLKNVVNDLLLNSDNHLTVTGMSLNSDHAKCNYTVECDGNYTLSGESPYVCTGTQCDKTSIVQYIISNYQCTAGATPAVD